ncbi:MULTISPECIES: ECF transporter S component [unclassified Enterococcus]|uniref:ECF transporter S component n=1 Tax=unclassified Enterococcus TaxID=2608891 RepID=UPI001555C87F|nr:MULTISPECIES: ECF transporter S component [unclassified Enterococcus]MBS7578068.1 ECF transporter S component [Enterococcus sp. MMGLQ5-2]MBS7585328.1 ECF transporter S component [Enterococcus sp. MMGLQ5-1]NPD13185.1 ECF transporter S component [Enterococcus sp. MMGLQ5-1]NPD37899.1 ECF transporter S component [Enterococcus sp. MMGLQ5-2]
MTQTRKTTTLAILVALLFLLAFTPLGFIPIPPLNPTIMHIPVIVGGILLGPVYGGVLGGIFGLISLFRATLQGNFIFSPLVAVPGTANGDWRAIIIALLPRILIGIVAYYVFQLFKKRGRLACVIAGVAGSLTNTILVMNLIFFIFKEPYAVMVGKNVNVLYNAILAIILTNGVFEAVCAGVITVLVVNVYQKVSK